jgi:tetratricopeptide (TPR) repeat protein
MLPALHRGSGVMPQLGCRVISGASAVLSQYRFFNPRQNQMNYRQKPVGNAKAAQLMEMNAHMAELCNNLAKVAHNARNYSDAIGLYDRVLEWRRSEDGPMSEKSAATLHNIGRVFMDMKQYAAAENALTEACAIYDKVQGDNKDMRFAESLSLLAVCYTHLKFVPEAGKAFDEALDVARKVCYNKDRSSWLPDDTTVPPKDPQQHPLSGVAHCLSDMAKLQVTIGKEQEALACLSDALAIRRYLYGSSHKFRPIIAQTLGKICEVKRVMADAVGARDAVDEAIDISIETLGRDSPQTGQLISMKGMLLCAMMKFHDAKKLFEESAATFAVAFGKNSSAYGDELVKLARCLESLGETVTAEKLYIQGTDILIESAGETHVAVLEAKAYFANMLLMQSELTRSVEIFHQVITARKAADEKDPLLAGHYHKLATALNRMNDTQAEVYYLLAIERFRDNSAGDSNHMILATDVLDDLGLFYCEYKHYDKAEKAFQESLDIRKKVLGERNLHVAYCYSNFALMYMYQNKYDECESFGSKSVTILKDFGTKADPRALADVQTTLGVNYYNQTRYNEAILYLDKSLNTRRKLGDEAQLGAAENMVQLARVYVKQQKWPRAKELLDEAKGIAKNAPRLMEPILREIDKIAAEIPPKEVWPSELSDAKIPKPRA